MGLKEHTERAYTEDLNAFILSLGINPNDNKPYISDPKKHYRKEEQFLRDWWNGREPVMGFTDDSGRIMNVDKNGYLIKQDVPIRYNKLDDVPQGTTFIPSVQIKAVDNNVDLINSPSHYTNGTIEAIDYLKDNMSPERYIGGLEWNVKKYLHRWSYKGNPVQDLKKAQWYLNKLIEAMEGK